MNATFDLESERSAADFEGLVRLRLEKRFLQRGTGRKDASRLARWFWKAAGKEPYYEITEVRGKEQYVEVPIIAEGQQKKAEALVLRIAQETTETFAETWS